MSRRLAVLLWLAVSRVAHSACLSSASLAAEEHIMLLQTHSTVTQHKAAGPALTNTSPGASEFLHAHSRLYVNIFTGGLVLGVACLIACGPCLSRERWVALMVFSSYLILIPGLVGKDFSMEIALRVRDYARTLPAVQALDPFHLLVPLLPERMPITVQDGVEGPIHQSTRSFVPFLWNTGSRSGAIMIAIFAFVVPVAKLLLLGIGECWRHHPHALRVRMARVCILTVQLISKWASPDMFAFMLLYYLVRQLDHPPLLESLQVFDIGFSCYNIFCVASVVSTMLVSLPVVPGEAAAKDSATMSIPSWLGKSRLWLTVLAACLTISWALLFACGLVLPCLSVRVNLEAAMEAAELPAELLAIVRGLHIEDMVDADVSLWDCACALWGWFCGSGELTLLVAAFMISVFVIGLTVLNMHLLVWASLCVQGEAADKPNNYTAYALRATYVVKHLAMLDVCVAGIIVISCAAGVYRSSGLAVGLMPGTYMLLGAEVTHYTAYYTITGLVEAVAHQELHELH